MGENEILKITYLSPFDFLVMPNIIRVSLTSSSIAGIREGRLMRNTRYSFVFIFLFIYFWSVFHLIDNCEDIRAFTAETEYQPILMLNLDSFVGRPMHGYLVPACS